MPRKSSRGRVPNYENETLLGYTMNDIMAMQQGSYKILLDIKTYLMDKNELSDSDIYHYNEILKKSSSYLTPEQIKELKLLPDSGNLDSDGGGGDGGGGDGGDAMNVVGEYLPELPDLGDIKEDEIPTMDMDLGSSKRRKKSRKSKKRSKKSKKRSRKSKKRSRKSKKRSRK